MRSLAFLLLINLNLKNILTVIICQMILSSIMLSASVSALVSKWLNIHDKLKGSVQTSVCFVFCDCVDSSTGNFRYSATVTWHRKNPDYNKRKWKCIWQKKKKERKWKCTKHSLCLEVLHFQWKTSSQVQNVNSNHFTTIFKCANMFQHMAEICWRSLERF